MALQHALRTSRGFTLIELMVVVIIATLLLSIAVPSYMSQIRQSRRTEARTAILDLSGREERYLSTNPAAYCGAPWTSCNPKDLGYVGFGSTYPIGSGYYYLTVCSPAGTCAGLNMPNPPPAPSYTIVATPVPGQSQVNDTQCQQFAVDSSGQQYATDGTGGPQTQFCWSN
jgi:type IV pilus assembly protein PilE